MPVRIIGFFILVVITIACDQRSSSRFAIVELGNDKISDLEKIRLFEERTDNLSGSAHAAIARLYANSGNYAEALESIHQAILQEPMNSFYHTLKSNYAYELNDISTAYREALTAYQLGSKSLQQSLILAKMGVALSEYSIVNEIIDSLVLVYPNNPEVVFMAARKLEKSGEVKKAIDKYRQGINLDPGRKDNYYQLAALYLEQGDAGQTLEVLRPLAIAGADLRLAKLKADAFSQIEELDSAARYYNLLVAEKKDSVIYQRLIDMFREHDRYGDLVAISTLSADSFPKSKYFLKNAGLVLDKRYQYNDALVYYRQLYELDTLDSMVAQEISILQRKIAYLQRKREVERMEQAIPAIGITLPSLDSLRKD